MNLADMVRCMTAAGCTARQINKACEVMTGDSAEKRRLATAERTRKYRERIRGGDASDAQMSVTDDNERHDDTPPLKESFSHSSKKITPTPFRSSEGKSPLPTESSDAGASDSVVALPRSNRSLAKPVYTIDFERFWRDYPLTVGKKEAYEVWGRLSLEDRQAAIAGLVGYKADLAKREDPKILHGCRFLKWRRFDDYLAQAAPTRMVDVPVDSRLYRIFAPRYRAELGKDPEGDGITARLPADWIEHFTAKEQQA